MKSTLLVLSISILGIFATTANAKLILQTSNATSTPIACEGRAGCTFINQNDSAKTGLKPGCWCNDAKIKLTIDQIIMQSKAAAAAPVK